MNITDCFTSLNQSDRDTLKSAAGKVSTHALIGSLVGLGLGAALAFRVRSNRVRLFEAFRAKQKPTHVKFADGREGMASHVNLQARFELLTISQKLFQILPHCYSLVGLVI